MAATSIASTTGTPIHRIKNSHTGLGRCIHSSSGRAADQKNDGTAMSHQPIRVTIESGSKAKNGNNAKYVHHRPKVRSG